MSLSEHRLRIDLTHPLPIFPALLTSIQTAIARDPEGDGRAAALVGTGPFKVRKMTADGIHLERFEDYWRSRSRAVLDGLEFRVGLKSSDVGRDLRLGQLDLARDLEDRIRAHYLGNPQAVPETNREEAEAGD